MPPDEDRTSPDVGLILVAPPPEIKVGRKAAPFRNDSGRSESPPDVPHRDLIAVRDADRALHILAGPGLGKTEMLVWRVLDDLCVRGRKVKRTVSDMLKQQCTACGERFGCPTYTGSLKGGVSHPDVDLLNVLKN
jgi:hypothetical protein